MFSLHSTVPPDGSSPGRGSSTFWQKHSKHNTSSHTTEGHFTQILGLLDLRSPAALLCSAFLLLTRAQTPSGLSGSGRSWATSGLWQVIDYSGLCPLLASRAKAKLLGYAAASACADLLVHLESAVSSMAMLLKLPGKLLWLKISSSTPSMSALVWMWTDYFCCWNISTVRKSTINYICCSTYKVIY